jgi:DNA modification methylase
MEISQGEINECKWKVYNGNCINILRNMDKESVDCIVTSPPYFDRRAYGSKPKSDGNNGKWLYANSGKAIEGEIGNGNDKEKYLSDIKTVIQLCYKILKEGRILFVNISTCHKDFELLDFSSDLIKAAKESGFVHWDTIIWIKRNPMPPGRYNRVYLAQGWEYILAFSKGKRIEINNDDIKIKTHFKCQNCGVDNYVESGITPNYVYSNIGCYGRRFNSVISHPAVFPIDIPAYCLSIATKKGELVLDPFVGSGTTLIAGLEQGLNVIGCELVPEIYEGLVKGMNELSDITKIE